MMYSLNSRDAGFTLLEVLVVIAIGSVLIGVGPGLVSSVQGRLTHERDVEKTLAFLRDARMLAEHSLKPVKVYFDFEAGSLQRTQDGARVELTNPLQFKPARGSRHGAGELALLFYPDGSSSGGTVTLGRDPKWAHISVHWLFGSVRRIDPDAPA